jgi:hypothetical protein
MMRLHSLVFQYCQIRMCDRFSDGTSVGFIKLFMLASLIVFARKRYILETAVSLGNLHGHNYSFFSSFFRSFNNTYHCIITEQLKFLINSSFIYDYSICENGQKLINAFIRLEGRKQITQPYELTKRVHQSNSLKRKRFLSFDVIRTQNKILPSKALFEQSFQSARVPNKCNKTHIRCWGSCSYSGWFILAHKAWNTDEISLELLVLKLRNYVEFKWQRVSSTMYFIV